MKNCTDCLKALTRLYRLSKGTDPVTYIRVKILKWAGRMVRRFDNRIPKRLLEGSLGGRRHTGKPRNTWGNKCGRMPPNCTIREPGGQRQDRGVTGERKRGGGQETGRRAV